MILLDTHIFLWLNLDQKRIPYNIRKTIYTEDQLGLADISLWEIAMLIQYGRVEIPDNSLLAWFNITLRADKIQRIPMTPEIAARSGTLQMHGDPADRLIAATAIEYDYRLATVDERLLNLPVLRTLIP